MTYYRFVTGLLWLFGLIALALLLSNCTPRRYCQPSPRSRDYATVLKLILRSDGWVHSVARNEYGDYQAFYECKPDSVQVGSTVWIGNYQRLRVGGRLQVSIVPGIGGGKQKSKS